LQVQWRGRLHQLKIYAFLVSIFSQTDAILATSLPKCRSGADSFMNIKQQKRCDIIDTPCVCHKPACPNGPIWTWMAHGTHAAANHRFQNPDRNAMGPI
jgi:hypothetical protein